MDQQLVPLLIQIITRKCLQVLEVRLFYFCYRLVSIFG